MEERYYLIKILSEKLKYFKSVEDLELIEHLAEKAKESSPEAQMFLKRMINHNLQNIKTTLKSGFVLCVKHLV